MIALSLFGFVILVLGVVAIVALRGGVISLLRSQIQKSEGTLRVIRTEANAYDRLDSVLSGRVIDILNDYDREKMEAFK